MIRRPPKSPLFPYTPLFRSDRAELFGDVLAQLLRERRDLLAHGTFTLEHHVGEHGLTLDVVRLAHHRRDRKSTRLNSSHANISYAVSCLKKNKAAAFDNAAS